jgi:hypothetical protein
MLIRTKNLGDSVTDDFDFDLNHPRYSTYVQRIARTQSQVATVTFNGQLTEFQAAEDSVQGGHPETTAIMNYLAEILLGLFVPWDQLSPLFQRHAAGLATKRDACAQVWRTVEPTLKPHIRNFAGNIDLLPKSKEDCQADAALWKWSKCSSDSFDCDIDEFEPTDSDIDSETPLHSADETFKADTLIAAFHSISRSWNRETFATGRHILGLLRASASARDFLLQNLQPVDISNTTLWGISGL